MFFRQVQFEAVPLRAWGRPGHFERKITKALFFAAVITGVTGPGVFGRWGVQDVRGAKALNTSQMDMALSFFLVLPRTRWTLRTTG